jgi:signal transduction histidine kinase
MMDGHEVNCIVFKSLIPFVEQEAGPAAAQALVAAAGKPREWLIADHNWVSLATCDRLVHLAMKLMGATDVETWTRRWTDYHMDWKPSHDERSYIGTYTMGLGSPQALFERIPSVHGALYRFYSLETVQIRRERATFRGTPIPGVQMPRWECVRTRVSFERYPTNWGLARAAVVERACAAKGDAACLFEVRWRNSPAGRRLWLPAGGGLAAAILLWLALGPGQGLPWAEAIGLAMLPALAGVAAGVTWLERHRRRETQRLRDIQGEEILHSNQQLERKFRDLEGKIDQLSLLTGLSAAVNATLDPEKIYEQALEQLVHRMGYPSAYLYLVDAGRGLLRSWRFAGAHADARPPGLSEFPLDASASAVSKVAVTGTPLLIADVADTTEPLHRPTAQALGYRSLLAVPLEVKGRVFGVLAVGAFEPDGLGQPDQELLAAVANHVALAVDRAESFQTIEELSRGLEDKVRVRTEQLRVAHDELQSAYRDLQATQVQLIQREKMASVGQLVAGVAHELNNPIGFVYSNVSTLEDFVRRLRAMLEAYRGADVSARDRERMDAEWQTLKIDYALKYLDSMTLGIKEGAERARKIVRDLRVFARSQDDLWQPVDLHEELDSSLTLLNHLLKDRVVIERMFGDLPAVECIRSQIDQVFLNVLANAAQAIQGPGTISIETERKDGMAVVRIADTGPGIAPEVLGRIFDPFFTTKPVGEGTGLGLSISYEILKKHGGDIRAENRSAGGAVFTIRLPLARAR